ncbi:hypothetical protein GZH46_02083, partial [Fragariocoptes setiger]
MENPELFEGDILLPKGRSRSWTIASNTRLWPNGQIPFVSQIGMPLVIQAAMQHIHDTTCIRFVPRTNEQHYITIFPGEGCFSEIGYSGTAAQPLSLAIGCLLKGTVIHELLHAVGFWHLHSRYDRDDYLRVHVQNIRPDMLDQFDKVPQSEGRLFSKPFDFESIMLYGKHAFARDPRLITMEPKDSRYALPEVARRLSMSPIDAA